MLKLGQKSTKINCTVANFIGYFPAESPVVVIHVIFILMFRFTDNPTLAGMAAGRHQGHSQ